jgi:hypothetical protein
MSECRFRKEQRVSLRNRGASPNAENLAPERNGNEA